MVILITTSRRTNQRVRRLAKELSWVIPFSLKINRGHMSLDDLRDYMYRRGYSRLLLITSRKGNPNQLIFLIPSIKKFDILMTLEIKSVKLQLDVGRRTVINELEIEVRDGDVELCNNIKEFIGKSVYDPTRETGIPGKLVIEKADQEYTSLKFTDMNNHEVYPRLLVRRKLR